MANKVACVKVGDAYTSKDVNRLFEGVKKNLTVDFDFVCLTDDATGLHPDIAQIHLDPNWPMEGYWWKTTLFDMDNWQATDIVLYFDLDVIIQNNIDYFFRCIVRKSIVALDIGDGHDNSGLPPAHLNSSVLGFFGHDHDDILRCFLEDPVGRMSFGGLDRFLTSWFYDRFSLLEPMVDWYSFIKRPWNVPSETMDPYRIKLNCGYFAHAAFYAPHLPICVLNGTLRAKILDRSFDYFESRFV